MIATFRILKQNVFIILPVDQNYEYLEMEAELLNEFQLCYNINDV